jgi:hypothetical protein
MSSTEVAVRRNGGGVVIPSDPITLGNVLAASGFFADSKGGAQAAVKVMAGQELGFGPIASMTGIYIVKGRVTLSANLMAAAIKRHPHYTFRVTEHTAQVCTIDFIEDGQVIGTSTFTMQDAKDAGLAGSETYKKFPKNMLYARALSNGAKWYCPDVFGGGPMYTPDELTDAVVYDADGTITHVAEDAAPVDPNIAQAAAQVLDAIPAEDKPLTKAGRARVLEAFTDADLDWAIFLTAAGIEDPDALTKADALKLREMLDSHLADQEAAKA